MTIGKRPRGRPRGKATKTLEKGRFNVMLGGRETYDLLNRVMDKAKTPTYAATIRRALEALEGTLDADQ